ncbi:MAG: hypothetical protein Q9209_003744 [Squamulea sp. 1 TL-2023]
MAYQAGTWSQWTAVERELLWNIANDPDLRDEKWEHKARYFNERVREVLPNARQRTVAAVYLQWKFLKDGQERMTRNAQKSPPAQMPLQNTQHSQNNGYHGVQRAAGSRADSAAPQWQNEIDINNWWKQEDIQTWLDNVEGGYQTPGGGKF